MDKTNILLWGPAQRTPKKTESPRLEHCKNFGLKLPT